MGVASLVFPSISPLPSFRDPGSALPALSEPRTWGSGGLNCGLQDTGQRLEEDLEGLGPQCLWAGDKHAVSTVTLAVRQAGCANIPSKPGANQGGGWDTPPRNSFSAGHWPGDAMGQSRGETDLTKEMSLTLPMSLGADTEGPPGGPGHAPRERGSAHSGGQGWGAPNLLGIPRCAQRPLCRRDLPSCLGLGGGSARAGGQGQGTRSLLGVPTVHSCKAGSVPPSSPVYSPKHSAIPELRARLSWYPWALWAAGPEVTSTPNVSPSRTLAGCPRHSHLS